MPEIAPTSDHMRQAAREQALDAAGVGIWEYRPDTNMINWDHRCQTLAVYPQPVVPADQVLALLTPRDRRCLQTIVARSLRADGEERFILTCQVDDYHFAIRGGPITDDDGSRVGVAGTLASCDQCRNDETGDAEDHSQRRIADLAGLFRHIPLGLALIDRDHRIRLANEHLCELTNRDIRHLVGYRLYDCLQTDVYDIVHQIIDTGGEVRDHTLTNDAGRRLRLNLIPLHQQAAIDLILVTVDDITVFHHALALLQDRETQFRLLADCLPALIFACDAEGKPVYNNQRLQACLGLREDGEEAGNWLDLVHPDDHYRCTVRWNQAQVEKQHFSLEARFHVNPKAPDPWRWYHITVQPINANKEATIRWLGTASDIHQTKCDELAKIAEAQQLTTANQELQQFVSFVSHDLKSPLRLIASYLDLALEDATDTLPPESRTWLQHAAASADRMRRLIHSLLSYARFGTDSSLHLGPVDLDDTLDQAVDNLSADLDIAHVQLCRHPLPRVYGDQLLLCQCLQNLISNAIKYAGDRPEIEVWTDCTVPGAWWTVNVGDNGPGVPHDLRHRLFIPFQRGDNSHEGSGIGLAFCSKIVDLLGGKIWVEERPNGGALFRFTVQDPHRGR